MRLIRAFSVAAVFFAATAATARAAILLEDDTGQSLRLEQPAERVITLAPHLAELMFDAGADDYLVGTVAWSNTPPAAKAVPRVGDGFRIDAERAVALRPDVVLAWGGGTPLNTIEQLRRFGLPVAVLTPRTLEDIPRHLRWIGRLTGAPEAAAAADRFDERLETLRETFAGRTAVDVFYQINDPQIFTIGGTHTVTAVIETCGGRNVFADLAAGAHSVTREAVIARNPEVILIGAHSETLYEAADWQRWRGIDAVRTGNVYRVDAETVARAAPRILDGVEKVCEKLEQARENMKKTKGQD